MRLGRTLEAYYLSDENRVAFRRFARHHDALTEQQPRLKNQVHARFRKQEILAKSKTLYNLQNCSHYLWAVNCCVPRELIQHLYPCLDKALEMRAETLEMMHTGLQL